MKDLIVDVLPAGGPLLFANTCRISADTPGGHPECGLRSARPGQGGGHGGGTGQDGGDHGGDLGGDGGGKKPPQPHPVCEGSRAPSAECGDRERGPRRAADLGFLRRQLLAQLSQGR
jgi:hypothetical protein